MSTMSHETASDVAITTAAVDTTRITDVLELTREEYWHALDQFMYLERGRYHLSGIKEAAGIGSRDTHVSLEQIKTLHKMTGRIIAGLDSPASHGPALAILASGTGRGVADLAAAAGVDADALRRHFDGQGPLSQIAYFRVMRAMLGTKTGTAWAR